MHGETVKFIASSFEKRYPFMLSSSKIFLPFQNKMPEQLLSPKLSVVS